MHNSYPNRLNDQGKLVLFVTLQDVVYPDGREAQDRYCVSLFVEQGLGNPVLTEHCEDFASRPALKNWARKHQYELDFTGIA